jgi:hypothetical protein
MVNEVEVKKIRKRQSYNDFFQLTKYYGQMEIKDFLILIHGIIDKRRGFHSQYNSDCALESIEQLMNDIKADIIQVEHLDTEIKE